MIHTSQRYTRANVNVVVGITSAAICNEIEKTIFIVIFFLVFARTYKKTPKKMGERDEE